MDTFITGKIISIKKIGEENHFFDMELQTRHGLIHVIHAFDIKLKVGDSISSSGTEKRKGVYVLNSVPQVETYSDIASIKDAFRTACNSKISEYKLNYLLDHLQTKGPDLIEVINREAVDFLEGETVKEWEMFCMEIDMHIFTIKKIFSYWKNNYLVRRLMIIGIPMEEIKKAAVRMNHNDIHKQAICNPFMVRPLSMQTCHTVCGRVGISEKTIESWGENFLTISGVVREIDTVCSRMMWASLPISKAYKLGQYANDVCKYYNFQNIHGHLYAPEMADWETVILNKVCSYKLPVDINYRTSLKSELNDEQFTAAKLIASKPVCMVSGGAGVGKTTLVTKLIKEFTFNGMNYAVCAFTGKATSRVKKLLGESCKCYTIHMLMNMLKSKRIKVDILIMDEASMINTELLAKLFSLIDDDARLIFIGDHNQLQPIGAGEPFINMLKTNLPKMVLKTDCRRHDNSKLKQLVHELNDERKNPDLTEYFNQDESCRFHGLVGFDEDLMEDIFLDGVQVCKGIIKSYIDLYGIKNITILSPTNANLAQLNEICRSFFVPQNHASIIDKNNKTWFVGDRVMMTENCYDIEVMNGEEGHIVGIEKDEVVIKFGEHEHNFKTSWSNFQESNIDTRVIELSWAITIHKSQGSEWDYVILYMHNNSKPDNFHTRNMIFTAITRSRMKLDVVGPSLDILQQCLHKPSLPRHSALSRLINERLVEQELREQNVSEEE